MKFFNPYKNFVGSFIPNCLLQYRELSSSAKLLWARLAQYAGENGYCYPSQQTLADELGLSERQVRNLLQELETKQFIYRETPQGQDKVFHKTTRYYFILHPIFESEIINLNSKNQTDFRSQPETNFRPREETDFRSRAEIDFRQRESIVRESEEKEKGYSNNIADPLPFQKNSNPTPLPPKPSFSKVSYSEEELSSYRNKKLSSIIDMITKKITTSKENRESPPEPEPEPNKEEPITKEEQISVHLDTLCEFLYREGIFPEAPAFCNTMKKQGKTKEAILLALERCKRYHPKEPWSYCAKIIGIENGNITERKHIERSEKHKKEEKDFLEKL